MCAEATIRALRGVDFLDIEMPGWINHIDVDSLDLFDCDNCVLGQLFGEYTKGIKILEIGNDDAVHCGFESCHVICGGGGFMDYAELTTAWKNIILTEREVRSIRL